ncbi:ABC transporter permease [Streptomyces himalayensis]|uniref:Sugar ABC transporter permease n=1 Tax=Streptomyces himalayensis subsp. himalayensis TaxID=2756131 RepID=A0A7W0DU35_9ACTN|nr:ABC transporter permease subunit [Streptomyces himalayensis]MBA2951252.1 sugar ABC transporter permease [Streptomyces himalayensis subsp. himalayensis]
MTAVNSSQTGGTFTRVSPPGKQRNGLPKTTARRRARRSLRRHWTLYLLMLVPLTHLLIFKYIPMANGVIAFKDYNVVQGIWASPWAGWKHFQAFLANPQFWELVNNTFLLSFYAVIAAFPIPIILALALNEIRQGLFKRTVQMVTYAPYFISTVVVVSMLIMILSPKVGLTGHVFGFFGVEAVDLLAEPGYFRHIYVWSDIWQTAGYSAVIYLAALAGVDQSLYEAARVDGATRLQKIWHVDLPSIMPTAVIVLILAVGNIMAIGFEKAFLMQNPLNLSASEIIATYVYKTGLLNADFSQATAIGLLNSVVNLCLLVFVNFIAKRVTGNGVWS